MIVGMSKTTNRLRMKESGAFSCGHAWTLQNQQRNGDNWRCKTCADEQKAARREALDKRDCEIRKYMIDGHSAAEAVQHFGLSYAVVVRACGGVDSIKRRELIKDPTFSTRAMVAAAHAVHSTCDELRGDLRFAHLIRGRQAFSIAMRNRGASLPRIGQLLNRDHTTILHGIRKGGKQIKTDPRFAELVEMVNNA